MDTFCKSCQDYILGEVQAFLPTLIALAPSPDLEHLYTYQAAGLKDLLPDSRPFRLVTVAVTGGSYVDRTSVIKAVWTLIVDSTTSDERHEDDIMLTTDDQFGVAHAACYAAIHEWVMTHDFTELLDAEVISGDVEEASISLVDTLAIDIYFNPALPTP